MKRKESILIADDEKALATMMASLLDSNGYDAEVCFSGEEALKMLRLSNYDLLVTDIVMPGVSGCELLVYALDLKPDQRILITSGIRSALVRRPALELSILSYLPKPFTANSLITSIMDIFKRRTYDSGKASTLVYRDLLKVFGLGLATLVLEVGAKSRSGRIYFDKGKLVNAETTLEKGERAFYEIMGWEKEHYSISRYNAKSLKPNINLDMDNLLSGNPCLGEMPFRHAETAP
ncbi:response regulator [bacterium]|nr:response regulator [bacterium]